MAKTAVVIRESGGIGDIICLDSAFRSLISQGFDVVHLLGMKGFAGIYKHLSCTSFEEIDTGGPNSPIPRRGRGQLISPSPYLPSKPELPVDYLKGKFENYDRVVDLFCPAWNYEISRVNAGNLVDKNRVEMFYESAGGKGRPIPPVWKITEEDWKTYHYSYASNFPEKYVILHTRSTDNRRNWPEEYVRELVKALPNVNFIEVDCYNRVVFQARNYRLVGNLPFELLACLVYNSLGLVCVDSGVFHLSAALHRNIPTIALYGCNTPVLATTYPCKVLAGDGGCKPCQLSRCDAKCKCKNMVEVKPEMVIEEIRRTIL